MCTAKKASYTPPKVDPAPTTVQPADVSADESTPERKRRRGRSSTELSTDRDTILGGTGTRTTLG